MKIQRNRLFAACIAIATIGLAVIWLTKAASDKTLAPEPVTFGSAQQDTELLRRASNARADFGYRRSPNGFYLQILKYFDAAPITINLSRIHLKLVPMAAKQRENFPGGNRIVFEGVRPTSPPGATLVDFHVNAAGLPSGMYSVAASFDTMAVVDQRGRAVHIDAQGPRAAFWVTEPITLLSKGRLGDEYYLNQSPQAPMPDPALVKLTGLRRDGQNISYDFEFEIGPTPRVAAFEVSSDELQRAHIYPLGNDPGLQAARGRFEGRDVWSYGSLEYNCGGLSTEEFRTRAPVHINRIVRALSPSDRLVVGDQSVGYIDGIGLQFTTAAPLVVFLDATNDLERFVRDKHYAVKPGGCVMWRMFADPWQMDLTYSAVPLTRAHPEWSARLVDEILAGHVKPGMTRKMIIWALGFPNEYGMRQDLLKLDRWFYDASAPFSSAVYFKNGRVVRYDPPGQLP
ncbi:MAG TPA: hypothetical protein VFO29_07995 [Candidatus Rubrimentiphilum sp.]|nr:hypothetical protein [Candidatus Rubrimentiphilum sp.]